ncbi:GcrA cell cycle regulator [Mesorhizobium sp. LNHC209A00]|uniref:GcrA cell cycle regulator n=1 Tax=Mesorhizobium sp. LNHC209A00 TaxID=1287226 RepID=UPI0003D05E13|nr:GcrA cell cycle regulator [Mesorhizobium sp. LNHC209A00]ESY99994.1 GcrA cell cycle regulator [Mesorhizobium sp. LNHC209A00]
MASYSDSELQAIAAWLGDGLSASRIAAAFSAQRGSPVSRNAIIGVVHRNAMLGAIGFSNGRGSSAAGTAMAKAAMLGAIGFSNGRGSSAAGTAMAKAASRAAKAEPPTGRAGAIPQPGSTPAVRPKRAPSPVRPRLFQREAGVLTADGQTYRFKVPASPRGPIGRQPHGVAMRFIDCLFTRCRAPLDLALEEDAKNVAPAGRPGQDMLCCGMRTTTMKSYCSYHQARFHRPVCEAG